jgi:protein phosphatase
MNLVRLAARTDKGNERGDNQDSFLALHVRGDGAARLEAAEETQVSIQGDDGVLLAVCDGMGGAAGGAVASALAVDTLEAEARDHWPRSSPDGEALPRHVASAVATASQRILDEARRDSSLAGMGTTATVAALEGKRLVLGQVGDSRAYLFRAGKLTQLTRDQNLAAVLVERGQLTPEEARRFEHNNIILQALGTQEAIDVDLRWIGLREGDVVLLCSDGLWGPVDDEAIAVALLSAPDCAAASAALIALAIENGAPDNVTCVVARLEGNALPRPDGEPVVAEKVTFAPPQEPSADDTQPVAPVDPDAANAERPRRSLGLTVTVTALAALAVCSVGGALVLCR